jgi:hypothetical protein
MAGVDGLDDLGVVDALEVMPSTALAAADKQRAAAVIQVGLGERERFMDA